MCLHFCPVTDTPPVAFHSCPALTPLFCPTLMPPFCLAHSTDIKLQECVTVRTRFRPVPLQWHFAFSTQQGVVVEDLLDASGKALNPKLEPEEVRQWRVAWV